VHHPALDLIAPAGSKQLRQDPLLDGLPRIRRKKFGVLPTDDLIAKITHVGQPFVTDAQQAADGVDGMEHGRRRLV
jgi:hypothetical protein